MGLYGSLWVGFLVRVYIRFCGNGRWRFRFLQRLTFEKRKSKQNAHAHHSVPRLGSACPNAGIAPWAAAKGHPWPSAANPASMPGCPLRNACVRPAWLMGRRDQRPLRGGLIADLVLDGDRVSPVGAGLLAKAMSLSMKMLNGLASSRAARSHRFLCRVQML